MVFLCISCLFCLIETGWGEEKIFHLNSCLPPHPWLDAWVKLYKFLWNSFLCLSVIKWGENAELGNKKKWTEDLELWLEISFDLTQLDISIQHDMVKRMGENKQTNKKHLCSSCSFSHETKKLRKNLKMRDWSILYPG